MKALSADCISSQSITRGSHHPRNLQLAARRVVRLDKQAHTAVQHVATAKGAKRWSHNISFGPGSRSGACGVPITMTSAP